MSEHIELEYHLPVSCVVLDGSVTYTEDTVLAPGTETPAPTATVALGTIADPNARTATIEEGLFRDTEISFELTEDRRLVSSSGASTGEAGKVALGVVGVAAAVGGAFLGLSPFGAAGLAVGAAAAGTRGIEEPGEDTPEDRVRNAYEQAAPGLAGLRKRYEAIVDTLVERIATMSEEFAADGEIQSGLLLRLRAAREVLAEARRELEWLDAHFEAWRATTLKTRSEAYDFVLTLDQLIDAKASVTNGTLRFAGDADAAAKAEVERVYETLGAVVTVEDPAPPESVNFPSAGTNAVVVRIPRRVRLTLHQRAEDGKLHQTQSQPYSVLDQGCRYEVLRFRKSEWTKHTEAFKFSPSGALIGFSSGATSTAAALADTAGALPGTVTGALDQSTKFLGQLDSLRATAIDHRLALLKKQVELKQQELSRAGLYATDSSFAELQRLKQEAEILEARKTISADTAKPDATAAELASLKQQIDLLNAKADLARAQQGLGEQSRINSPATPG